MVKVEYGNGHFVQLHDNNEVTSSMVKSFIATKDQLLNLLDAHVTMSNWKNLTIDGDVYTRFSSLVCKNGIRLTGAICSVNFNICGIDYRTSF